MQPQLKVLVAAGRVMCNRLALSGLGKNRQFITLVQLAYGTVLSQPLRPAMPDPRPHPLRFGWVFESLPLDEQAVASIRKSSPASLVTETPTRKSATAKGASDGHEESDAPDEADGPVQGLPEPEGLLEGGQVHEGQVA